MNTALIVIDAQESFRHRPDYSATRMATYLVAQNALIEAGVAAGIPLVRVLHSDGPDSRDNPFATSSGLVRPLEGLAELPGAAEFRKSRHSALVGTGLEVWLVEHGIRHLIVSGIRTEQCCETTTRHASDLGWGVDYVTAATLTFDIARPDGRVVTADALVERTEAALDGRFATLCTVTEAIGRAQARKATAGA